MYCSKCGAQLDDDSIFCPNCGTSCTSAEPTELFSVGVKTEEKAVQESPVNKVSATSAASSASYYAEEFAKIAAGQKPKFNWAAFFLGPYHQLYHGSVKLFKKTFLPYMIATVVLMVLGEISVLVTLATFSIGALVSTIIAALLYLVMSVWALILFISNGKKYNQRLYEQVEGRAEDIPAQKKTALLTFGTYTGIIILIAILISVIGSKMVTNAWMSDLPMDNGDVQTDSSYFIENDDNSTDGSGNEVGNDSPWLLAEDENFWEGAWQNTTTGQVTTFARFAGGIAYFDDGHIDENGNYVVYVMSPGEIEDEKEAQLLVSSDGKSLMYYIPSNIGGMIASDAFERPTAAQDGSLPSELWGNYSYSSGPERDDALTVDAFRINDNPYFNGHQESDVWVVETGNGIEGWSERLTLLPDGRLSIQDDYATEPTYYVRVSALGQSAGKESAPEKSSIDLSQLPQIPFEDTNFYSVCFWTGGYTGDGFDGVALQGDNSVTIGTLFSTFFDSYFWDDSYSIQQQTEVTIYDAVCRMDGNEIRLRFSPRYTGDIQINQGSIYKTDGTIQSLSQYDIACLMYALNTEYHQRNGTQPYSLARTLCGTWLSTDGQTELTIDGEFYGGDRYKVYLISQSTNELYIGITRKDGTVDYRWIEIMGDSMTVYDIAPMTRNEKGNPIGTFNRVA